MADNSFGIKELNLVGSGTPKIQSPNNINLEAVTVAISTNATVGGTLNVGGVITGDGSGLTGVVGSGSGVIIKHDGATVGTAGTIDFSTNLDVSAISGAAVTITASGGGGGSTSPGGSNTHVQYNNSGIFSGTSNLTFNGTTLSANTINLTNNGLNLISSHDVAVSALGLYINNTSNTQSIASFQFSTGCQLRDRNGTVRLATLTTGVNVTGNLVSDGLDVNGNSDLNGSLDVSGITTFNNDVDFKGSGGTTKILFDASQDALEFADSATLAFGSHPGTGDYQINYVNGGDFAINAMQGGTQDLVIGRYENASQKKHLVSTRTGVIELYHDNTKRLETTSTGVIVSGILSSSSFVGDGSGLTGVVGSGSGVVIKHDGATVGTAGTIDFSTNLDVSAISGAAVTITASGGGAAGIDTTGTSFFNQLIVTGISTFGNSVSIGHSGSNNNTINFTTNDSNYGGSLQYDTTTGKYYLYSTYQGTTYTPLEIGSGTNNYIKVSGGLFYPASNNGTDLGSNSTRFKTIRVTDVDAVGVATVANKINVGTGATIDANGQAIFTGIITSKSSIRVEGGSLNVDIGSLNQGFYLYNGNSSHLGISWSSSASRNQFSGDAGGSHPLWFEDFSYVYVDAPLSVSSGNDFKVGLGVTIQSSGGANFVGVITANSFVKTGGTSSQFLMADGSTSTGGGGGGGVTINNNTDNCVITASGISNTINGEANLTFDGTTLSANAINVSGIATVANKINVGTGVTISQFGTIQTTSAIYCGSDIQVHGDIRRGSYSFISPGTNPIYYAGTPDNSYGDHIFKSFTPGGGGNYEVFRIGASGDIGILGENYGTSGQVLTSGGAGSAASWTTVSGGIGTDGSINTTGIITAAQFSGVGNDIVTSKWTVGASGSNYYTFTGPGGLSSSAQPKIYLARGQTYEFLILGGSSHPFQIQQSNGTAYNTGVTNNNVAQNNVVVKFEVPFSAPNTLQYVCTVHGGMGNTIIVYPDLSP